MPETKRTHAPPGWGPRAIVATAAGLVLLTIALSALGWWLLDRPASEFPAWLEAFATVIGVGAATIAGFYAARAFLLEHQREQRWEENQQASQAALVAAWPHDSWRGTTRARDLEYVAGAVAMLRNASPLPVSQVSIDFYVVCLDSAGIGRDRQLLGNARLAYLRPAEEPTTVYCEVPDGAKDRIMVPADQQTEIALEVWFRDAAGEVWSRDQIGQLIRASDNVQ